MNQHDEKRVTFGEIAAWLAISGILWVLIYAAAQAIDKGF